LTYCAEFEIIHITVMETPLGSLAARVGLTAIVLVGSVLANPIKEHTVFDHAAEPSTISSVTDGDLFESITGRKLRTSRRFLNADATKLHQAQRKAFEDLPTLGDACERLIGTVKAEQRRDDAINLRDLHVDDVGALTSTKGDIIPGTFNLGVLEHAWGQLVARAPRSVPSRLRSNVNAWIRNASGSAVLRTLETEGARDAFALVSERYQAHDADQVASELARAMAGNDLKGQVKYLGSGGRYEIEAALARPFDVPGDGLHRVVISARSSDDGTMSQQIVFKAWRLKCLNGMFIADRSLMKKIWHKGNADRLREQFADGLVLAREAIESFSVHWSRAQRARFVDATTGVDLTGPEALRRIVGTGEIAVPGVNESDLLGYFMTAWEIEPGDSLAAVVNSITRSAHENGWRNSWTCEALEEQAGRLVYGQAHALPPLTVKQAEALAA
jgi:hypothetical protein